MATKQTGPNRRRLILRLETLLEKQVAEMERGTLDQGPDKEIALLGTLARTLEKLIELDEKQKPAKANKTSGTEMTELRKKLADRIRVLESSRA
ncbi:MAG: hypothetical protein KDJ19_08720 [Hyphomicrobiaceae bacterium]|nr:hypothetical protein [Hyphomicrobiaceae bacterium]MCC0023169.1 hypothetical protein [Hyphomicrobiaceae bacterium]